MMSAAHDRPNRIPRLAQITAQLCAVAAAVICFATILSASSAAQSAGTDPLADQYIHTDFTVEQGLPDDVVNAVVQTTNGLLWVGTAGGLASFDGREFTSIDLGAAGTMPQGEVHALLESSDGDLWVGTDAGVVLIPQKALDQFDPKLVSHYQLGSESNQVYELAQTREGGIWAGASNGLYHFEGGRFVRQAIVPDGVYRISEALNGNLLLIGGGEFLEWDGHRVLHHPGLAAQLGVHASDIFDVFQDRSGTMWYGTARGLLRRGERPLPPLEPSSVARAAIFRIRQDRDGPMWMTSNQGLLRVRGDRLESPEPGLSIRTYYAAPDGDLWLGTNGSGLIHLRRRVVRMYTTADGLQTSNVTTVLLAHDGKLWIGGICGFSSFDGSTFRSYAERDGLLNTCVRALAEDHNHDLWIGTYGGGAFRMHDGHFIQYSKEQGLADRVVVQFLPAQDGSMWFGTPEGLSHLVQGRFRNYTVADGLSSNQVLSIYQTHDGSLWVATRAGLDRFVGNRFLPFPGSRPANGWIPSLIFADSLGNLYVAESPNGLSRIEGNRVVDVNDELNVLGMIESPEHDLRLSSKNGILRIRREDLMNSVHNSDNPLDYQVLDRSDGLTSTQCSDGIPNIALTPGGELWVATVKGLAMIELARSPLVTRPPKVLVGGVTVGTAKQLAGDALTLPPGTHHLELHLEAADLASPEKVRIQYRMDGVDPVWLDAGASRTAIYSNLPLGTHNFHVRASATDGVWDRTGIIYKVTQQRYFYQTMWFVLLTATIVILLFSAAYFLRLRHVLRLVQMRMDERVVERERIARELHDTLLQGFQGLTLHLQAVMEQIPDKEPARQSMKKALIYADGVLLEGRQRVRDLRPEGSDIRELSEEIAAYGEELAKDRPIAFKVTVVGAPEPLHPMVGDDMYRIAREALTNAFRHAEASKIEVEITYDAESVSVRVRDNGAGIGPEILESGKQGHWGLLGMRERAHHIGAQLNILSNPGSGTEVDLSLPAKVAYARAPKQRRWHWFSRNKSGGR